MQPYSIITVQQLNDHLSDLRLEAARARLTSRQNSSSRSTLLSRVLKRFGRSVSPSASKPAVRHL